MAYYRALDISVGDNDLAHFKYIKRWREGNEWRYQYPGDGSSNTSASRNGGVTAPPGTQPIQKRNFGIREAMNYAHAKRQANNYQKNLSNANANYNSVASRQRAVNSEFGKLKTNENGVVYTDHFTTKIKNSINAAKDTYDAKKQLNTANSAYNQAKQIESNAKSNFENTTLGQAGKKVSEAAANAKNFASSKLSQAKKQIENGNSWLQLYFGITATQAKENIRDFAAGAYTTGKAVKEGVESISAARKSKQAYDTYMKDRNSNSNLSWDEYNRKRGINAQASANKEHKEYESARNNMLYTETGRRAGQVLDKVQKYVNDKYNVPAVGAYKSAEALAKEEEARKKRARAAAGYRTR